MTDDEGPIADPDDMLDGNVVGRHARDRCSAPR